MFEKYPASEEINRCSINSMYVTKHCCPIHFIIDSPSKTYGRIIVDPVAFRTFQPNCTFNFYVYKRLDQAHLTEEEYMICTPIVLGFCFGVKEWGVFESGPSQSTQANKP